jgi:hypothetical protein
MCNTIDQVLQDVYGVNVFNAPPIAIVWAAEFMAKRDGIEVAKAELSEANRRREKAGKRLAHLEFGHPLF